MLDLTVYPELDLLAADLMAVTGKRVIVDVTDLPDGFAVVQAISELAPFTKIIINSRFSDLKFAITGVHISQEIQRAEHPGLTQRATMNPRILASLNTAISRGFGDTLPKDRVQGLGQLFFDGIARQITSVLHMLRAHRLFAQRCPSLRQAHDRFLGDLFALNLRFFQAPIDPRFPASVVKSNLSLLGVETLGLYCLLHRAEPTTATVDAIVAGNPWLADKGLAQHLLLAFGPVSSLLHGDLDPLDFRDLTLLACRHGKVDEQWVDWVVPDKYGTKPPSTPLLPKELLAETPADRADTAGKVALSLAEGDREALLRLIDEGYGANADVLLALAEAELLEGDEEEATRVAKLVIGLDATSAQSQKAAQLINVVAASRVHKNFKFRPDIFYFLRDSYLTLTSLPEDEAKGIWMECAEVTANGVNFDSPRKYQLKSLKTRYFSGQHLVCLLYAGIQLFGADKKDHLLQLMPMPYDEEWNFIFSEGKS